MLKSNRRKLIEYMKDKSDALEELTDIKLYNDKDYEWATNLTNRQVDKVLNYMVEYIEYMDNADSDICPQCIIYDTNCKICDYTINHNSTCSEPHSPYRLIIRNALIDDDIIDYFKEEDVIQNLFKWNNIKYT